MSTDYTYDEQAGIGVPSKPFLTADWTIGPILPLLHPHYIRPRHPPPDLLPAQAHKRCAGKHSLQTRVGKARLRIYRTREHRA